MKVKQSQEKKNATKRYCCIHKLHYFDNCPACWYEGKQALDKWIYGESPADHVERLSK
jgi:hypothetical protein